MIRRGDRGSGLLAERAAPRSEELVEILAERDGVRIERIVSHRHCSPEGFWYDQEEREWVALLAGRARLLLLDPEEVVELTPGDWIDIAVHRRHRVEWTDPEVATIWLAVFSTAGPTAD